MPTMKCPGCATPLATPAPQCPNCKFTLRRLDAKFGAVPLHSRYLTDRSDRLPASKIAKVRESLQLFERKFPQSLFSVFVIELPPHATVNEYAFWLANRARFSSIEAVGAENFDLLLVVDPAANAAAFTVGYGLEKYVSEDDLDDALMAAFSDFQSGNLAGGIRTCIEWTTRRMRDISREVAKQNLNESNSKVTEAPV
ncbi:MAG: TPM domain-containing protein [Verrucomicrobiota bacterium]|nr:TPM domain-containing protein [Verrucomicrobiota bacterium]